MSHVLDSISFGVIVKVRDRLFDLQAQGKKIYRLESGDPNFDMSEKAKTALVRALQDGHTHYTASTGIHPLRKAIVEKLKNENAYDVKSPDNVVVTSGGMHALFLTFSAILNPGDEVIIPDPMWTEIAENIKLAGGVPVRVPIEISASGMKWTAKQILKAVNSKTRAIFVNNPHNPTGMVLGTDDLREIVRVAEENDLIIVSDEAYEHVIFDRPQNISVASLAGTDRVLSLYSTSKSYAMSGLRVGYVATTNQQALQRMAKLLRCSTNGVNSLAQWAAKAAIEAGTASSREMASIYKRRRNRLWSALTSSQYLEPVVPEGSFFMWARIKENHPSYGPGVDEVVTEELINKFGVGSVPGSAFFGPGGDPNGKYYVRFAFSCDTTQLEEAASYLVDY